MYTDFSRQKVGYHIDRASETGIFQLPARLSRERIWQSPILSPRHYQRVALGCLSRLLKEKPEPAIIHRLRTTLRRLQAYCELVDLETEAAALQRCVSRLSRLRAVQVFEQHLVKIKAPMSDLQRVRGRLIREFRHLKERDTFRRMQRRVGALNFPLLPDSETFLHGRMTSARRQHADELEVLLEQAIKKPKRKRLHAIRLKIKAIRYQEEWAAHQIRRASNFLKGLKKAQNQLGRFEELADFKVWAKDLRLSSRDNIQKAWRRTRKRARKLPARLPWIVDDLRSQAAAP
jgi:hypothetical protein